MAVRLVTREEAMLPIEMAQLAETELDLVCGGYSENNISASNFGLNIAVPQVESVRGGPSNVANIAQGLNQANFSAFFAQGSLIF
jgi:hypothetical protein